MRYTNAVYKTADSSTTLQISNRAIVEHHEQMGYSYCGTSRTDGYKTADSSTTLQMSNRVIVEHSEQMVVIMKQTPRTQ